MNNEVMNLKNGDFAILPEAPYSSTDVAEGAYISHEDIEYHIMDFVRGNINSSKSHMHMREILDDII